MKLTYLNLFSILVFDVFQRCFPSIRDFVAIKPKYSQIKVKKSQFGTRQYFRQFYRPSIRDLVAPKVKPSH